MLLSNFTSFNSTNSTNNMLVMNNTNVSQIIIGANATIGTYNTSFGANARFFATTGTCNTGVGANTLVCNKNPTANQFDNFNTYIVISVDIQPHYTQLFRLLFTPTKIYHMYNKKTKEYVVYLSGDDYEKNGAIEYYDKIITKWMLIYQLKDQYEEWANIFSEHMAYYYALLPCA